MNFEWRHLISRGHFSDQSHTQPGSTIPCQESKHRQQNRNPIKFFFKLWWPSGLYALAITDSCSVSCKLSNLHTIINSKHMQIGAARGPGLASLTTKQSTNLDCINKYFKAWGYHWILYLIKSFFYQVESWELKWRKTIVLTIWILNVMFPDDVLFAKCR